MAGLKKTLIVVVIGGLLLTAALVAGVLGSNGLALAQEKGITVRVLLYSGRPDPTYELADSQVIEKVKAMVAEAKKLDGYAKESVIPANIGYKGILVSNPEKRGGLPVRFAVYKGTIELMDGQKQFLEDKGGAVEKMLMDEAIRKGVIEETILKRMKKEKEQ